jgi:hypothetical protein
MASAGGNRGRLPSTSLRKLLCSDRALVLAGAAVVLIVLLVTLIIPYLDQRRDVATEVPQPEPLFALALAEFLPNQQVCSNEIGLLPGKQVARMRIGTFGKPAVPLLFTLSAPGYRESVPVPATYVDNGPLAVEFDGPTTPLEGEVCVANRGHIPVALYASSDRTKSRSLTTVDGNLLPANFDLAFYTARPQSLLDETGSIMRRLRLFHAHVGLGLLWLLAVLFAIGMPLASVAVLAGASRRRAQRAAPEG